MGKLVPVIVTREAGTCVDKFWGRKVEGECLNCSQLARNNGEYVSCQSSCVSQLIQVSAVFVFLFAYLFFRTH